MKRTQTLAVVGTAVVLASFLVPACQTPPHGDSPSATDTGEGFGLYPAERDHLHTVMTSRFCGTCHPAIYAEHGQNTHGRAFTDPEPRMATGRFAHGDCIRCHTPRPIFETGSGMNPMRRHHNLEEGNTCMTCHWKPDHDYSRFVGGAECVGAFDDRVGSVAACSSCHRNHGTPYQWEKAPTGKASDRTCMDCHMAKVRRPVAVGQKPRMVRSHVFPGSRSEAQLRRAYRYEAEVLDNEVVVRITNKGAGHNFPTELKQRSVESLVVVFDTDGKELYRSRMVFRDPYKRPYGLMLPVNTQIPGGQTREHRVPLKVAAGRVDCELHFKLYFPIEDNHPELARRLELRRLVFDDVTPSTKAVESAPVVKVELPPGIVAREAASAPNFVDFVNPEIGRTKVEIPTGDSSEDIKRLIELFQFPVPEASNKARRRIVEIGKPAVPQLIETLGSWDNKTWKAGMKALVAIGREARPAVMQALDSDQLYVRVHARKLLVDMGWQPSYGDVTPALLAGLEMNNAFDRATAAETLGLLGARTAAPRLRTMLAERVDPDVVRAAAMALARLQDRESVAALKAALRRAQYVETRRDLAVSLAMLGSPVGVPLLIDGLDHHDDLIRESFFEALFQVTDLYMGYEPLGPRLERLEAIARIRDRWARRGSAKLLRTPMRISARAHADAWLLVQKLGGGAGIIPGAEDGNDDRLVRQLTLMGPDAVPALVLGLKVPIGFAQKRFRICEALGRIRSRRSAPALAAALRDPVVHVAAEACWALSHIKHPETLGAVKRYQQRLLTLAAENRIPATAGSADLLITQAVRTRLLLGDDAARNDLVSNLLSADVKARQLAIDTLAERYGERRGYDAAASLPSRRAAVTRWQ
ncbi:MAG: HEAT repeat domain-containing protein [Planctomycetota bacterium]|jgi:HEAT repeat protein